VVSEHDYREAPEAALESPDPREGLPQDPTSELHWYASRPWLENRPPLWVRVFSEKQTRVVLREEKHGCHLGFIPDAGSAGPLLSATYLPVVSVSGVFVPIAAEPGWLATVARWLPAEPFIHALSTTLQAGGSGIAVPPAGDLLNCALWAVVGLYVALRHFRWEPRGDEHRGHATTEVGAQ
jgi:hypothetical protein